ncbi:hypothetical protein ACFQZC_28850 [Streptacidiphilus monticola]
MVRGGGARRFEAGEQLLQGRLVGSGERGEAGVEPSVASIGPVMPGAGGRWVDSTSSGSRSRSGWKVSRNRFSSTFSTHGLSTLAQSNCMSCSVSAPTSRTSGAWAASWVGSGAPKQSELKQTPVESSKKPTVQGLSKSGGRKPVRVRSPTSSDWPGLSRNSRSSGSGRSQDMMPTAMKVVTTAPSARRRGGRRARRCGPGRGA